MDAVRKWELVSGRFSDGEECLTLKNPNGSTFCVYAPGRRPYQNLWQSYWSAFPKEEFSSRESCIQNAEKIAGHPLIVRPFECFKKVVAHE